MLKDDLDIENIWAMRDQALFKYIMANSKLIQKADRLGLLGLISKVFCQGYETAVIEIKERLNDKK